MATTRKKKITKATNTRKSTKGKAARKPAGATALMRAARGADVMLLAAPMTIGTIQMFAGTATNEETAPGVYRARFGDGQASTQWLVCDGTAVSLASYPLLHGLIGFTYDDRVPLADDASLLNDSSCRTFEVGSRWGRVRRPV